MIQVDYCKLSKKALENYFNFLVGKVFKILPMSEESCETLTEYLEELRDELTGNSQLLDELVDEPQFITLLNIIQYLISNECEHKKVKKKVFSAIRIIEDINNRRFKDGGV